jgi:hypothetical protein
VIRDRNSFGAIRHNRAYDPLNHHLDLIWAIGKFIDLQSQRLAGEPGKPTGDFLSGGERVTSSRERIVVALADLGAPGPSTKRMPPLPSELRQTSSRIRRPLPVHEAAVPKSGRLSKAVTANRMSRSVALSISITSAGQAPADLISAFQQEASNAIAHLWAVLHKKIEVLMVLGPQPASQFHQILISQEVPP